MSAPRIATRYAEALFQLARDHGEVAAIRQQLEALAQLVHATPQLQQLLARPDLPVERKLAVLARALGKQVTQQVMALLATLVQHGRGEAVEQVVEIYDAMADEDAGIVAVEAATVVPLTPEQRTRLITVLARMTGQQVRLHEHHDQRVLAGVRLTVGDRMIDGSADGRLTRLREELIAARG